MTPLPAKSKLPHYSPLDYSNRMAPVMLAAAAFYLAALFLNAEGIQNDLALMGYGPWRNGCLAAFKPVVALSRTLKLTQPKTWIEQTAGIWIKHAKITP